MMQFATVTQIHHFCLESVYLQISPETFGIYWSSLANTNQLYTSSDAFWKSETYWKQIGLYLHGSMSD